MAITQISDADGVINGDLVILYDFFGAIRRRLRLIAAFAVLGGIIMGIVAFTMTPIYRGLVVLEPITEDNNPLTSSGDSHIGGGIINALTSGVSDADRQTDEEMTVLTSRDFTEKFISDNNLMPVLFPKLWDERAGRWKDGIKKIPSLARGYVEFDKIRKIDLDQANDFVTLQIDWRDGDKAAEWANKMAERLNEELRGRAIANANASIAFLNKELETTSQVETRMAISRLIEGQIKTKMLANVTTEFEVKLIDRASPPDPDFPQRPNKILMIAVGLAFGLLIGIAAAILLYRRELSSKGLL